MQRFSAFLSAMLVTLGVTALLGWYFIPIAAAPDAPVLPTPRIVGGETAPVGAYPWMTALVVNNASPAQGQFCGGSLIHREWVMTAAHCVTSGTQVDPPGTIDIVVGLHQLSLNNGIRRDVQTIVVHPQWNPSTYDYDIALLRLAQPIDGVTPVALAQAADAAIFDPGDISRVIGWGATAWQGGGSDTLLQVDVPIVSQESCNSSYTGEITDRMICAGLPQGGKDSCQGDSGGPQFADSSGIWKQIGIVSWGYRCAQPAYPGIYARVSVLYDWVAQHVELVPSTPTPTSTPTATSTPTVTGTPPTLTPTPTATHTPIVPPNPLVNGDFEHGSGVGWTEYSALGYQLIMNGGFPGTVAPHSGQWAVWLGGDDDEISYVSQSVAVQAGAAILGYWVWIASNDYCGYDFGGVIVNSTVVDVMDLCESNNTGGWVRRIVDLSAYAGQSVTLQIRAETDFSYNSNMFVDDVTLSSATAILMRPAPRPHADASGAALPKQLERVEPTDAQSAPAFRLWMPAASPKP